MRKWNLVPVFILVLSFPAWSWRELGHFTVCELAYRNLLPEVKEKVDQILGEESFSEECTWPDKVRVLPRYRSTYNWHFVNLNDGLDYFDNLDKKGDLLSALIRNEDILRDPEKSPKEKREALKFFGHFVGDLHQPLHVGKERDLGGNRIRVSWYGQKKFEYTTYLLGGSTKKIKKVNLHKVMDFHILNKVLELNDIKDDSPFSYMAFSNWQEEKISSREKKDWIGLTYYDWLNESLTLRGPIYEVGNKKLGKSYFNKISPVTLKRIRQAGIRLGHRLNQIFKNTPLSGQDLKLRKKLSELRP